MKEGGKEREREGERREGGGREWEGGRERGREGGEAGYVREGGREGGKGGRVRKGKREGGREGGKEPRTWVNQWRTGSALDFVVCSWERGRATWLGQGRRPVDFAKHCHQGYVLTLGGNDLNNRDCQPDQLAKDILNVARSLIRVDGFQKVPFANYNIATPFRLPDALRPCTEIPTSTRV